MSIGTVTRAGWAFGLALCTFGACTFVSSCSGVGGDAPAAGPPAFSGTLSSPGAASPVVANADTNADSADPVAGANGAASPSNEGTPSDLSLTGATPSGGAPAAAGSEAAAAPSSAAPSNPPAATDPAAMPPAATPPAATPPAATPPAATPPAAMPPAATPPAAPPATPPPVLASNVRPSPGCGKAGRPANGTVMVANDHIYDFPQKYDGKTPLPVVFGFHANANPIDQIRQLTRGTPLASNYVMVFPKSVGQGWVLNTDKPRLDGWYKDITQNYCVDESRVFATGHSSGAQFIVQLLCQGEDRFTALAPVASSMYCTRWNPLPTLLIHGSNDMERANTNQDANGRKDLGPYLTSNGCSMNTQPRQVAGCTSQFNGAQVNPNCMSYQGCSEPMIWCSHNDLNYSGTNHGWPCFASQAMFDFFSKL